MNITSTKITALYDSICHNKLLNLNKILSCQIRQYYYVRLSKDLNNHLHDISPVNDDHLFVNFLVTDHVTMIFAIEVYDIATMKKLWKVLIIQVWLSDSKLTESTNKNNSKTKETNKVNCGINNSILWNEVRKNSVIKVVIGHLMFSYVRNELDMFSSMRKSNIYILQISKNKLYLSFLLITQFIIKNMALDPDMIEFLKIEALSYLQDKTYLRWKLAQCVWNLYMCGKYTCNWTPCYHPKTIKLS